MVLLGFRSLLLYLERMALLDSRSLRLHLEQMVLLGFHSLLHLVQSLLQHHHQVTQYLRFLASKALQVDCMRLKVEMVRMVILDCVLLHPYVNLKLISLLHQQFRLLRS